MTGEFDDFRDALSRLSGGLRIPLAWPQRPLRQDPNPPGALCVVRAAHEPNFSAWEKVTSVCLPKPTQAGL